MQQNTTVFVHRKAAGLARVLTLTSLFALGVRAQTGFEGQFYRPLDLARAAVQQHGLTATVVAVGDHLYDWRARVGRTLLSLDLQRAVDDQYGTDHTLVTVGVHRDDWRAVRFTDLRNVVLPVMPLASDRFFDVAGVLQGLARFRSVLTCVQNWYRLRAGSTFRLLQPLVIPTGRTAATWNAISASTANSQHRFALLDAALADYDARLPAPGSDLRVVLSPYAGDFPDVWLGAAASGRFAVAPQRATSVDCPPEGPLDARCADATYAVGHELGHTFGLGHACEDYPNNGSCQQSIMQAAKPWNAILLEPEIVALLHTAFFPGSVTPFGAGCSGENGVMVHSVTGVPALGRQQVYRLRQGPTLRPAVLALGASDAFFGRVPLPLSLTLFGAPGCWLYVSPMVTLALATDATGAAALPLTHPNAASLIGRRFFTQFLAVDPTANAWGLTTTNGVTTRLGR
jgi:hypothetical protein